MLSNWGYIYLVIGTELSYAEAALERYRSQSQGVSTVPALLDPNDPVANLVLQKCDDVLRLAGDAKQELGAIPANVEILKSKITAAKRYPLVASTFGVSSVLDDVRRIRNDFIIILERRFFYYLRPEIVDFWGQPELFGEAVAKKFRTSRDDIEHAGNCLALGESTACVLHLLRAMEAAVRRLGQRLHITINPKDTWGMILNNMDKGIEALPDRNEKLKRKKAEWAECRVNLYHVKLAWRDDSMHGKVTYDERQARDILEPVKVFMQQLATL
jgi:hypothetical protein